MTSCKAVRSALLFTALVVSQSAYAQLRFLQEPVGQFNGYSCQSYALAVALAFRKDGNFQISTADQLRRSEEEIRVKILAAKGSAAEVTREHVKAGFKAFTGGAYVVKEKVVNDIPTLGDSTSSITGISVASTVPPAFLIGATVKDVVLTSVTRVGTSNYPSGHFISLLGVDGPPNSSRKYLVLNGGIKVDGLPAKLTCVDGVPDKPSKYDAGISWLTGEDLDFKAFAGKYVVWTVGKP